MAQVKENERDRLLEQYKIYVEIADRVSERRIAGNSSFFSLVNTLILSSIGIIATFKANDFSANDFGLIFIMVSLAGLLFTFNWRGSTKTFRTLSAAKFRVIHEMEKQLPFPAYETEWRELNRDNTKYASITNVEGIIHIFWLLNGIKEL